MARPDNAINTPRDHDTFDRSPDSPDSPGWTSRRGRGFLAVCASIFLPGLGHFIVSRNRRGCWWLIVWVIVAALAFVCLIVPDLVAGLIVLIPLQLILTIVLWIDAYRCAIASPRHCFRGRRCDT